MVMDPGGSGSGDISLLLQQGVGLIKEGRRDEAVAHLGALHKSHPQSPEVNYLLASALLKQGRADVALEHLEKAASIAPSHLGILDGLAALYDQLGRFDEALKIYDRMLPFTANEQDKLKIVMKRGVSFGRNGNQEKAEEAFRAVLSRAPKYAPAWHNLGNTLAKREQREDAVAAFGEALKINPDNPLTVFAMGRSLLWTGQYADSLDHLTRAMELSPFDFQILSYKILALQQAGRVDEADALEGINDMILPVEVPHPPEYGSVEEWNEVLAAEIANHPALTAELENHATRNGAKVLGMFTANRTPIFEKLERQVFASFEETVLRMPEKKGHPLPLKAENGYFADMWANVLYDGGHQIPHNNPRSWFSACYYVQIPDRVTTSGDAHEGWIEFGGSAYEFPEPTNATKRQIQPHPGLMLVFPSYIFHRTIPFTSDQTRISCAFDAIPLPPKPSKD